MPNAALRLAKRRESYPCRLAALEPGSGPTPGDDALGEPPGEPAAAAGAVGAGAVAAGAPDPDEAEEAEPDEEEPDEEEPDAALEVGSPAAAPAD